MNEYGFSSVERLKHVSKAVEQIIKYPYPWHLPRSFRNYIAHEYFGINLSQVYKTVTDLLPDFKILIDRMFEMES